MTANLRLFRAPEDVRPLRCGTRLDQYRLKGRLGEGGFATVYSAYDNERGRLVAIKIPESRYVSNQQTLCDLKREVEIMDSVKHPAILPLIESRIIDGYFVIVTPLGQETLADRMMRRMSRPTAMQLIYQMTEAIGFAHDREVLHRDVKPENFILFSGNEVRLTDFGLARIEHCRYEDSASGTLGYIAPEQALGKPGYPSDVFSLGMIVYRMLSGELPEYPFQAPLPGFNKLRRGVSRPFVDWVRKAIDPSPAKRFRTAGAMHRALKKIANPLSGKSDLEKFHVSVRRHSRRAA
ncbi:MAG: serine/threonine-protein kinase [Planctomycetota bacterium]